MGSVYAHIPPCSHSTTLRGSLDCAVSWSLSGEAESGSAQLKMWNSNNVETSFPLTNRDGLLDWPGCGSVKPYLDREKISQAKIHGLAEIFDKIDAILSKTSLTPLIWLLLPIIGFGVMIPLIITENYQYIWMPWVFPQSFLHPLQGYYYWIRKKQLKKALLEWNRDVGAAQGFCLELGVDGEVRNYWKFEGAFDCGKCRCLKQQANLLLCRLDSGKVV